MTFDLQAWASLLTLTALEVVLSVDNLVVIAVLVGKLAPAQRSSARYVGMTLALVPRLVLLLFIGWIIGLTEPLFTILDHDLSGKDLILAVGGLFLIYKATQEIHGSLEGEEGEVSAMVHASYAAVVTQIALVNLVFSIDSIVTAVGMANEIWIMAVAVVLSMVVLMAASGPVAGFVDRHPTVKILALGFLIMIGMALVADAAGFHIPKGYIYSAMIFSIFIESINMLHRRRVKPVELRNPFGPEERSGMDEQAALAAAEMPGAGASAREGAGA
jgi:predicted tellurium resistance membrane protein TerC